jgi:hypothetical protein
MYRVENLTGIGTEYESFPHGPALIHQSISSKRPRDAPTVASREQWLADIKTQHYQLTLTNEVMSGPMTRNYRN